MGTPPPLSLALSYSLPRLLVLLRFLLHVSALLANAISSNCHSGCFPIMHWYTHAITAAAAAPNPPDDTFPAASRNMVMAAGTSTRLKITSNCVTNVNPITIPNEHGAGDVEERCRLVGETRVLLGWMMFHHSFQWFCWVK